MSYLWMLRASIVKTSASTRVMSKLGSPIADGMASENGGGLFRGILGLPEWWSSSDVGDTDLLVVLHPR
jgi:hypothetical protein